MNPQNARHALRIAAGAFLALVVLGAATLYWGLYRADELSARADNPRRIEFDRRIQRGAIRDRWGEPLAVTERSGDEVRRRLLVPEAASVVGFQTWRYGAGALEGSSYGAGGVEAAFDRALRGDQGMSLRELVATRLTNRSQTGRDVRLTIDAALQREASAALEGREGAIVIVDVASGAVRALVSEPTFDPATLDDPDSVVDTSRLLNRATQGLYPPGSIWKTVTLVGTLEERLANPDTMFHDGDAVEYFDGFPVRCDNNPEGVNEFDLRHAYAWSCNVTFARLASQIGVDGYRRLAARFGAGEELPFALGATAGSLSADDRLDVPELASAGFGQGELLVTPLQMALVAAAVAGSGEMPRPWIMEEIAGLGSDTDEAKGAWLRSTDPETARQVRDIMTTSVREGWASTALAGGGMAGGGKTGTAEVADGNPHAWFIGFAPADDPKLAIAVLVVHGGEGSSAAAPIAGRLLEIALEREQ